MEAACVTGARENIADKTNSTIFVGSKRKFRAFSISFPFHTMRILTPIKTTTIASVVYEINGTFFMWELGSKCGSGFVLRSKIGTLSTQFLSSITVLLDTILQNLLSCKLINLNWMLILNEADVLFVQNVGIAQLCGFTQNILEFSWMFCIYRI